MPRKRTHPAARPGRTPVFASSKPPYRVPSMAEIDAVRGTNGYRLVSTFSGCGGSCLGFEMAGYRVLWASEFIEEARTTYEANHPDVHLDGRDIRQVQPGEILEAVALRPGQLDVFEGSPPCASFSMAGKREKLWGQVKTYSETSQRADDLFFEYVRLLEGLKPRVFVAENVSGLVRGKAIGYFKEIHRQLAACGYLVDAKLLDAQWLGVPQARQRVIFMGVRQDLGIAPRFPKPYPYRYSFRDALPDLPRVVHDTSGLYGAGDVTNRPSPTITAGVNSVNSHHFQVYGAPLETDPETGYRITIEGHAIAKEWDKLREGEQSDRYFNLVRPRGDLPCPTVTAANTRRGVAGVTHPEQRRKLTLAELRRICGFPDDFVLTGTYQQRWERLARAVPPLMMARVADAVRGILDEHHAGAGAAE